MSFNFLLKSNQIIIHIDEKYVNSYYCFINVSIISILFSLQYTVIKNWSILNHILLSCINISLFMKYRHYFIFLSRKLFLYLIIGYPFVEQFFVSLRISSKNVKQRLIHKYMFNDNNQPMWCSESDWKYEFLRKLTCSWSFMRYKTNNEPIGNMMITLSHGNSSTMFPAHQIDHPATHSREKWVRPGVTKKKLKFGEHRRQSVWRFNNFQIFSSESD